MKMLVVFLKLAGLPPFLIPVKTYISDPTIFVIPLSVSISGPSRLVGQLYAPKKSSENKGDGGIKLPPNSATGTWTANASGGIGGYSYQWYRGSSSYWIKEYGATNKKLTKKIYGSTTFKCVVTSGTETAYATKYVTFIYGGFDPKKKDAENNTQTAALKVIPTELSLNGNYPNPFNPSTTIKFGLPEGQNVKLVVYNVLGEKVISLQNGYMGAGYQEVKWNGKDMNGRAVASGVYIYSLEVGSKRLAKKMFFAK